MNKNNKTLIFIDWDDTLFPTTWYNNATNIVDNSNLILKKYDNIVFDLLSKIKKTSEIVIVTNATINWINKSGLLLQKSYTLIKDSIRVVSARDKYILSYPLNPSIWKAKCFEKIINNTNYECYISIGDSEYERDALIRMYKKNKGIIFKTIKFIKNPSAQYLYNELMILLSKINNIITEKKHNDLVFTN